MAPAGARGGRVGPHWQGWILASLGIAPDDDILEVGCGGGVLVSLMCAQLGDGRVTAIDRSATAIRRAAARSSDHVAAGRALLRQLDLARLDLAGQRFDKIVAVNVSALWIGPADTEWDRVLRHLRPAGTVHLFHRSASPTRTLRVAELMAQAMAAHGLASTATFSPSRAVCAVAGRRPGRL